MQTSEYIEDSHHQYELASLAAAFGCACTYFICKVVYNIAINNSFINKYNTFVMFHSCFDSLASVVPIKLVRIAWHRALRHTVRTWAVVVKK